MGRVHKTLDSSSTSGRQGTYYIFDDNNTYSTIIMRGVKNIPYEEWLRQLPKEDRQQLRDNRIR